MVRFVGCGWLAVAVFCACRFDESGQGAAVAPERPGATGGAPGTPTDPADAAPAGSDGPPSPPPEPDSPPPAADAAADPPDPPDPTPRPGTPPVDAAPPAPDGSAPTPSPPATPGPVAHWRFDEGAGAMASDASGSGNTGTLLGGPEFVSPGVPEARFPNPGALRFDGDDDQVVAGIDGIPAPQAPKTISLWVRPPIVPVGSRAYISLTNRALGCGVHLGSKGAMMAAWRWGGDLLVSRIAPPGASWHHVLYSFDGVRHSLRIDGGPPEVSNAPTQVCPLTHVVIGNYEGGGNWFQGTLDDIRIYDRPVTDAEARTLSEGQDP